MYSVRTEENMEDVDVMTLTCPDCGGRMQLEEDGSKAVCPYCGHSVLLQKKDGEQAAYEYHMGRARAEQETAKRKKRASLRKKLIVTGIVLLSVFGILMLSPEGRHMIFPRRIDPFRYARITVSGESGSGRIEVTNEGAGELAELRFSPDGARALRIEAPVRLAALSVCL